MGLIYSSSDSSAMMRALSSNLAVARTTTSELTAGCQQLIAAIDGHTLSGAAYNAGKGLFSELVIPTIHRMTAAVDNVQSDLAKYSAADAFIASEGFLDEDKLKLKIKIMKANQQLLHDSARAVSTLAHSQPIPGIYELLQNAQRTFIKMAESMQQDIDKLHKQIRKLNEFDRQTKNLFATSLEEMQLAMQGILVLNETTVKSNGLYTLPSGVDKSYFTEIKKDTKNEVTDKQLLEGCTIIRVHDRSRGFEYYMLEKDGYSYRIDEKKLSGNLAYLVKKYDLDVVELTPKELTTRANNQQKKGYNYFEKDDRVRGLGLLSKGQGVMDEIQESGVWDSLWMLGMGVASVRNAQTFSNGVKGTDNAALRGSKNGKTYVLDKPKSTGNVTYKKASGAVDDVSWSLNKNGATINGRKYSGHVLERMAPDTPDIRAQLHTRAQEIAKGKGYVPGTREYSDFIKKYVQPRNVPPSVIEDAITNGVKISGNQINTWKFETGDVTVIINDLGDVITVIPK
ncbi:T7SS effector LXG polymorphic toxin [Enterococcus faecalis]|uniref:T7SS effector LXG polymorphic toxin n=1 Tax=Enterococcus faecalis TaxID=1351 RepID=UPI001153BC83|nr:T7SS effector LXG polymorphic toxin [Enterococcus faecalis]QDJ06215.1 hypothetical protein FLL49_07015 [Enterococcus faecalis]